MAICSLKWKRIFGDYQEQDPENSIENRKRLAESLNSLPPRQHEVIQLLYFENHTIVKEKAADDPVDAKNKNQRVTFITQELFPNPLTFRWEITKGADLMWVPMAFEDRMRLVYSRTFYGTG